MKQRRNYELNVNITIRDNTNGGHLSIHQDLTIGADGFMQVAAVLGKFHELAETLNRQHAPEA